MEVLLYSIIATLTISLISLVGIFTLGLGKRKLESLLFFLVSFSAGTLIGSAFFHLIPEALDRLDVLATFKLVVVGFILFFILEKVLRWHHCHDEHCEQHKTIGFQNLFADALHNFLDGLIIVSSFAVSPVLGLSVTASVTLHEIPQEISDFGVLIYSGFSKTKALAFNLLSALTAVLGSVAGFFLIERVAAVESFLLPIAAGGFLYIAAADMVPELHKENQIKKSSLAFVFFLAALGMMLIKE